MIEGEHTQAVGSIARVEFYPKDAAAARKYFETVFGWKMVKESVDQMDIWRYETPAGPRGVMMASMGHVPPGTTAVFVRVASIDVAIKSAEKAGGKMLVPKYQHPGVGWFAWFESPGGIAHAVFQPSD